VLLFTEVFSAGAWLGGLHVCEGAGMREGAIFLGASLGKHIFGSP